MKLSQRDHNQIVTYEHNEELNAKRVEIVGGDIKTTVDVKVDNTDVLGALLLINESINKPSEEQKECCAGECGNKEPQTIQIPVVETRIERIEVPVIVKETVIQTIEVPQIIIQKEFIQGSTQIVEKVVLPLWIKMVMGAQLLIIFTCLAAIIRK